MKGTLVSVIVPTKNSAHVLGSCLNSIKHQTYKDIELIVVDNNSTDNTKAIAKGYTKKVYNKGPERSAQRNYAVTKASGKYVVIIDSDMELTPTVIASCVEAMQSEPGCVGAIIPEESFGEGFWARCKAIERSFYVGVDWMEAARFFPRDVYLAQGGYDENLVSGEDWDLSQRVATLGRLTRVSPYILHNEGKLKLSTTLRKKLYYAQQFSLYTAKQVSGKAVDNQTSIAKRYGLFFKKPRIILVHPLVFVGMLYMKTLEFGFGGLGYITAKATRKSN